MEILSFVRRAPLIALALLFIAQNAAAQLPEEELGQDVEGKVVNVHEYNRKVRILMFWNTDCIQCIDAIPALTGIQKLTGQDHLQVIAINQKDNKSKFKRIVNALGDSPLVFTRDRAGKIAKKFGAYDVPYFVVIGADGNIASEHEGFNKNSLPRLVSKIDSAIIEMHELEPEKTKLSSNP